MTIGRPTIFNESILAKTREYLDVCVDEESEYHKTRGARSDGYERLVKVNLPTIEGLALHLKVHRDTLYAWEKDYAEFSDMLEELRARQAETLINKALSGDYNSVIAKLILSKHGYKEERATDVTTSGKPIQIMFDPIFASKNV